MNQYCAARICFGILVTVFVCVSGTRPITADFNVVAMEPSKIFTPNGDCVNDYFTIRFDNPKDSIISGLVFDMTGRELADFKAVEANSSNCTVTFSQSSISWDGKDRSGNPVDAGVYLYQIKTSEGTRKNGTIVVAR